ncbi:hypothetical protein LUZ63_016804 [Rhynchospora breviuscula]|uniref:Reverse transcriptase domain-containing protein n=1 Tax=Rhynchospora breviuscula TaxID=2022672 RepID=A0A9Q0C181_9POAL|nr:hypothetical protein LUZ63_016804 [Rhynchospora breviuscula]
MAKLEALRRELEAQRLALEQERVRLDLERQRLANERPEGGGDDEGSQGRFDDTGPQPNPRTLRHFATPKSSNIGWAIVLPGIATNNLNITPAHINLVQQNSFTGLENADLHAHLQTFGDVCSTIKMNGVTPSAIRLLFFPFTLTLCLV